MSYRDAFSLTNLTVFFSKTLVPLQIAEVLYQQRCSPTQLAFKITSYDIFYPRQIRVLNIPEVLLSFDCLHTKRTEWRIVSYIVIVRSWSEDLIFFLEISCEKCKQYETRKIQKEMPQWYTSAVKFLLVPEKKTYLVFCQGYQQPKCFCN